MAGGPTTTELVAAASAAGAFAFVAGAYRSAGEVEAEIRELSRRLSGPFGVNIFVPGRPASNDIALSRYLTELEAEASHLDVQLGRARWDDDDWDAKVEVLIDAAPAVISFTFGCPPRKVIDVLHRRGSLVMVTVTNVDEAGAASGAGADLLCAQGAEAGAHRGTFDDTAPDDELPTLELLRAISARERVPIIAAGGVSTAHDAHALVAAGALAVQAGTAFLRSDEAGTSLLHRTALDDPRYTATALTRSFTGRRARGLVNGFLRRHHDAPSAFPEIHHATRPIRAAATKAGDDDRVNLWAGTGFRHARSGSVASILDALVAELSA
jgi:nitronate monooxygenase